MTSMQVVEETGAPDIGPEVASAAVKRAQQSLFLSRGLYYAAVGATVGLGSAALLLLPAEYVFSWRGPLAVIVASFLLDAIRKRRQSTHALSHPESHVFVDVELKDDVKKQKMSVKASLNFDSLAVILTAFLTAWLIWNIQVAVAVSFAAGALYGWKAWRMVRTWEPLLLTLAGLASSVLAWLAGTDSRALATAAIPAAAALMLAGCCLHLRWRKWATNIEKENG